MKNLNIELGIENFLVRSRRIFSVMQNAMKGVCMYFFIFMCVYIHIHVYFIHKMRTYNFFAELIGENLSLQYM